MFKSLCILGRQPALGLAELESLYGAERVKPIGDQAALLDIEPSKVKFAFLGGTVKFCKVLNTLDTTNWDKIQKFLENAVPEHAARLPEGKLRIGLSVYGIKVTPSRITATGLSLKKTLSSNDGRSSRIVPNTALELNAAQVLYNQLTAQLGWELIFVENSSETIVAQTIAVQDIDAYTKRDRNRPKRDARVGMLPPKLAQIIINLAVGIAKAEHSKVVLDPFCGTGVLLMEAMLMGHSIYGSDIDARLIKYSNENLQWLLNEYHVPGCEPANGSKKIINHGVDDNFYKLEIADATKHIWQPIPNFVASEVYLGRAFTSPPSHELLTKTAREVNTIIKKFLTNLARQTRPGLRLCLAVPAWQSENSFWHLPLLDNLKELGYNRVRFVHAAEEELIYHRPGQFVGRELITLIRN